MVTHTLTHLLKKTQPLEFFCIRLPFRLDLHSHGGRQVSAVVEEGVTIVYSDSVAH